MLPRAPLHRAIVSSVTYKSRFLNSFKILLSNILQTICMWSSCNAGDFVWSFYKRRYNYRRRLLNTLIVSLSKEVMRK